MTQTPPHAQAFPGGTASSPLEQSAPQIDSPQEAAVLPAILPLFPESEVVKKPTETGIDDLLGELATGSGQLPNTAPKTSLDDLAPKLSALPGPSARPSPVNTSPLTPEEVAAVKKWRDDMVVDYVLERGVKSLLKMPHSN